MNRGEIYWADLPEPLGRRPAVILTRDAAIPARRRVTVAPVSRTTRNIPAEISVGKAEGLRDDSVASMDNILTIPKSVLVRKPLGVLGPQKIRELDGALRFALDIRY